MQHSRPDVWKYSGPDPGKHSLPEFVFREGHIIYGVSKMFGTIAGQKFESILGLIFNSKVSQMFGSIVIQK